MEKVESESEKTQKAAAAIIEANRGDYDGIIELLKSYLVNEDLCDHRLMEELRNALKLSEETIRHRLQNLATAQTEIEVGKFRHYVLGNCLKWHLFDSLGEE